MVNQKGKKVVLIDKETPVRSIVKRRLEEHGYRIWVFDNAQEAFLTIKKELPDFVILEHELPDKSGLDLCRDIKSIGLSQCRIILFTFHTQEGFEDEYRKAGAAGIVYKPTVSELVALMLKVSESKSSYWDEQQIVEE